MLLEHEERKRVLKLKELIKKHKFDGIDACNECEGTGMYHCYKNSDGSFNWSGEYCGKCKGVGYMNADCIVTMVRCSECNGAGTFSYGGKCRDCDGRGFVDWVTGMKTGSKAK